MKKRAWTVMPIYLIFVLLMIVMAFISLKYSVVLFLVEIGVSLIAFSAVLVIMLRFDKYVKRITQSATSSITSVDKDSIEQFSMAVAVLGEFGEILMYNSRFEELFCDWGRLINENISSLFIGENIHSLSTGIDGTDTSYKGKKFTVYANKVDKGYMIFVIDNTYYKNIEREFYDTKKSVALVVFDNIEEFSSDDESIANQALISVESVLSQWSLKRGCLFRKLSDGRYIVILDEKLLISQIEKKFRILSKVHSISFNDRSATISIGIGRGCSTLIESHNCAKKALDMALGRGGDQVAVLDNGEYEFFGGNSKGVERTSKVRVRVFADSIRRAVEQCDKVLVMGHRYSDLDCIGSAVGIYSIVTKAFSKPCYIVTDVERSMAKQLINRMKASNKADMFISSEKALSISDSRTLLFIVDTHSPDFIESNAVYKSCVKTIVIDHHRKMVNFIDDADVFFHEPTASSTSEMVSELVSYLGDDCLNRSEAEALLSGIMLDTKNFVIKTGVRTFEAAAYLRKKGADTVVIRSLFANTIDIYKDKYELVSSASIINHCAVAVADKTVNNSRLVSAQAADDLLSIQDVYASFVISKIDQHTVNISARSYGKINVQVIMEKLNGGGHQTMAAAQLRDVSVSYAEDKLIEILKNIDDITA